MARTDGLPCHFRRLMTTSVFNIATADVAIAPRLRPDLTGLLRRAGLRPTRQRAALASLLFAGGDRHVTAEVLHAEAVAFGERVSLATVYNTLHQFRHAGLLRELAVDGTKA